MRLPDVHFWITPKRLHLKELLSSEEPEYRYRKAKDPVERTHLLIVRQLPLGKTTREVSEEKAGCGALRGWLGGSSRRSAAGAQSADDGHNFKEEFAKAHGQGGGAGLLRGHPKVTAYEIAVEREPEKYCGPD